MSNFLFRYVPPLERLWNGSYSLATSFWGFFLIPSIASFHVAIPAGLYFVGMPLFLLTSNSAMLAFGVWTGTTCFVAYQLIAAVGVWRSAERDVGDYVQDKDRKYTGGYVARMAVMATPVFQFYFWFGQGNFERLNRQLSSAFWQGALGQ